MCNFAAKVNIFEGCFRKTVLASIPSFYIYDNSTESDLYLLICLFIYLYYIRWLYTKQHIYVAYEEQSRLSSVIASG